MFMFTLLFASFMDHTPMFACVSGRCVAMGAPSGALISPADCGDGCPPLGTHEYLAARRHWLPRRGLGLVAVPPNVATDDTVQEEELRKDLLDDGGSSSAARSLRGEQGRSKCARAGAVAALVDTSSASSGSGDADLIVLEYPHPRDRLGDPTCGTFPPTPAPSPPPPPTCQENICAGPDGPAFRAETAGVNFTSTFTVPPIGSTFEADAATLYLYYNLVMDPGDAGTYNQFVPQVRPVRDAAMRGAAMRGAAVRGASR